MISQPGSEPAPASLKAELRSNFKARIAALEPGDRRAQEEALLARFAGLPGFAQATNVLLFAAALPEEPPTIELCSLAYAMNKNVLLPRVHRRQRRLSLHLVAHPADDLCPGSLGIPEPRPELPEVPPAAVDWALIPGLGFDERGFRLGRGGGYYDRLIVRLRPEATCWALCLTCQLVTRLPVEPHDAPLNGVSTPERDIRGVRHRC